MSDDLRTCASARSIPYREYDSCKTKVEVAHPSPKFRAGEVPQAAITYAFLLVNVVYNRSSVRAEVHSPAVK